jgi:hypothetical protein
MTYERLKEIMQARANTIARLEQHNDPDDLPLWYEFQDVFDVDEVLDALLIERVSNPNKDY